VIANTPKPPYYAVIFTNIRTDIEEGYGKMSEEMVQLAEQQAGYLGHESVRNGLGITVSYWKDLESIRHWKSHTDHLVAQKFGREKWYSDFRIRIALIEKDYGFEKAEN
jgi:heme-degrading monooxygenase HmoA